MFSMTSRPEGSLCSGIGQVSDAIVSVLSVTEVLLRRVPNSTAVMVRECMAVKIPEMHCKEIYLTGNMVF